MTTKTDDHGGIKLWLSARDTHNWAYNYPRWPGSDLAGHALFVELDANGDLIDLSINGRDAGDIMADELTAIIEDHRN